MLIKRLRRLKNLAFEQVGVSEIYLMSENLKIRRNWKTSLGLDVSKSR
jgi:hypothetical protein